MKIAALKKPNQQKSCGNRCKDFDADCADISDKLHCWKYDITQGYCPYLSGEKP